MQTRISYSENTADTVDSLKQNKLININYKLIVVFKIFILNNYLIGKKFRNIFYYLYKL